MARPWYPFYFGDYVKDTRGLSLAEHGAYLMLMAEYYQHGKLEANAKQLYRVCSAFDEAEQQAVDAVLFRFFTRVDGECPCWVNGRIEEEIEKSNEISRKRAAAGRNGGKKSKANAQSIAEAKEQQMPTQSQPQPHKEIKHYSASGDAGAVDRPKYSDAFEAFWSEYPNKKDKAKAYAAWKRKKLDGAASQIIERVREQKSRDAQWLAGFIPHGSTYINGERWEDEIETQRGGRNGSHRKTHADYRRELEQAAEPGLRIVNGERLD